MSIDHISDLELVQEADGEVSETRAKAIRRHLTECWQCRARKFELERAISDVVHEHNNAYADSVPPIAGPRALLRARLAEAAESARARGMWHWQPAWAAAIVLTLVVAGLLVLLPLNRAHTRAEFEPNLSWTPGATRPYSREGVCASDDDSARISDSVAQAVFREYGIRHPRPGMYEVDYLIPPALGGSDDPRNLWPQPYATGPWSARVKDALEDRLRSLVCEGKVDLATAQRELSRDWIAAYKKYFQTDRPLINHARFVKDPPWE